MAGVAGIITSAVIYIGGPVIFWLLMPVTPLRPVARWWQRRLILAWKTKDRQ